MYEKAESFYEETDRDLERRVKALLADRNLPALRRLGVRSHQGVVTLRGRVGTFYEKQLSGQAARRVAGVVDVIDATEVASDESLLSAPPTAGRNRQEPTPAPALVSLVSDRGAGAEVYSAGGLDPISQVKG
jgi:hypothetical protein